jgi:hypothetical protein
MLKTYKREANLNRKSWLKMIYALDSWDIDFAKNWGVKAETRKR